MAQTYVNLNGQSYESSTVTQPSSRAFRGAWATPVDNVVIVNMDAAKEIHRNNLRAERQPIFDNFDVNFMMAIERGNIELQEEISAQKQVLRDVTSDPRIDAASTPEELEELTLEVLLT